MCTRATIITRDATNTPSSVECTCRGFRPTWVAPCRTVHLRSVLVSSQVSAELSPHLENSLTPRQQGRFQGVDIRSGTSLWLSKSAKLIHLQTVGEILWSSGTSPNLTSNTGQQGSNHQTLLLVPFSLSCGSHQQTTLSHMEDSFDASCSCSDFLGIRTCSLELLE